jgi:hypothetical protein
MMMTQTAAAASKTRPQSTRLGVPPSPLDATGMGRDKVARADALISTGQSIAAAAAHIQVNKRMVAIAIWYR